MAGAYPYPLLVELEEANIPRLKNKLVKFFQSKKSNGGDCEVEYENGSRTAILRFCREEDQKNVLAKQSHHISLDNRVLKVTVRLPTEEKPARETPSDKVVKKSDAPETGRQQLDDESNPTTKVQTEAKGGGDTLDEELRSASAVLGNISDKISQEFLEMLVENIVKVHDPTFSSEGIILEIFPDISSAVVTFHSEKENTDFVASCPQNWMFIRQELSVQPLEVTKQVLLDDAQNFNTEYLQLYFENEGGDVEEVLDNIAEQSAVITFKDHQAVQKILKKKLSLKNEEIRVYPYYESLGRALYGKNKPSLKLPAAMSEPADSAVLRYLAHNKSEAETICSEMEKHFCIVTLGQTTVTLSPASSLLKQKDAKVRIKGWTDTVKSAFTRSVSKFKSLKFHPDSEAWEESEKKIRELLLNEDVIVVPDKASGVLSVAGLVSDVNRLERSLSEIINKTMKKMDREKLIRFEEIKVSPSIFHLLYKDGLEDRLLGVYPELKMSPESPNLKITGLGEEIIAARKVIFDAVLALKRQSLEADNYVLELLKDEQQEELADALLTAHQINAAFDISGNRVQLLAVSDRDLCDAQAHLTQLLRSQHINVEDSNVLKKPEWQQLVRQLEQANSKPCRTRINTTAQQVVVSGYKDNVIKVSHRLNDFLTQNAHIEETVVVNADIVIEYLKQVKTHWLEKVKDKVTVSYRKEAICLSGSRVDVTHCKTVVEDAVSSVVFDSLNVYKSGVKKLFQENEAMFVTSIKNKTGCLVQLSDKTGDGQDNFRQAPTPLYQLKTPEGVEIAVYKADMCSYPVQAVVSPSNQDLKHNAGLAAALLKAAGPQLQDECDKIIKKRGQLKPGDCVITNGGGRLYCKKVIHVVGPKFEKNKPQKAWTQLKKAVTGSLELAETHGCISVALPSIGRGLGCFPLKQCELIIAKAVKEYCNEKYDDITLQKIHLVNIDPIAVQDMVAAVRQEFGNHGVTHSQQTPAPNAPKPSVLQITGSDSHLCHAQTKWGLDITLTKGNIEAATPFSDEFQKKFPSAFGDSADSTQNQGGPFSKIISTSDMHEATMGNVTIQVLTGDITKETTDIIVNFSNESFTLKKGVSKAILEAAGQAVEMDCHKLGAEPHPGIITTRPGNLKSKMIPHLVGQTDPVKINTIVKDALQMCVKRSFTSVSFPAIGTGKDSAQARLVADAMLDAVIDVLSQNPSSPLATVRIVIFQKSMLKDFHSSMQQREVADPDPKDKGGWTWGGISSKIKALFIDESTEKPKKEKDFVIEALKVEAICVHICGETQVKVDIAKKWINEHNSMEIEDNAILRFSDADRRKIFDMQKTMDISIRTESNKPKATITIEGLTRDVLRANTVIIKMLSKVRDEEELMRKVELASTMADWQYQQPGFQFQSFDEMTNFYLEEALQQNLPTIEVTVQGQVYTVTMPSGPATDIQGNKLIIKRTDKLREFPESWDHMSPNVTSIAFPLQAGTQEYDEIQKLFQATCKQSITKIERIQNPGLWTSLLVKKRNMERRNGHQNNERHLFHGTCENTVPTINDCGFNGSYAGTNAADHVNSACFAVDASCFADDTYSKPNQNGEKFIYVCLVLTGDFTNGTKDMIVPPRKNNSTDLYDSVVDNVTNPKTFFIFHDAQAYPEYLITFK